MLIINADDWGLSAAATDAAVECYFGGRISAVSAMVFMPDSQRSAEVAQEIGIDAGLHLNLTEPYASNAIASDIREAQAAVTQFLHSNKFSAVLYNPRLTQAFRTTVAAQIGEFRRLYGADPTHIDGHHHQHLCANVLFGGLLPRGSIVRRHFTFFPGEKSWLNRTYRALCDRYLSRRCTILGGFFDLAQHAESARLERLAAVAESGVIEIMTHPADAHDYDYLMSDEFGDWLGRNPLTSFRDLGRGRAHAPGRGVHIDSVA